MSLPGCQARRSKEQMQDKGVVVLTKGMVRPRSLLMLGAELQQAEQAAMH